MNALQQLQRDAQRMPLAVRQAFCLRKVYDCGQHEIAARMNKTLPEVEELLARALLYTMGTTPPEHLAPLPEAH